MLYIYVRRVHIKSIRSLLEPRTQAIKEKWKPRKAIYHLIISNKGTP